MKRRGVAWLIVLLLLSGCGVFKVVKTPEPASKGPLKTLKFEGGNEGDAVAGWKVQTYKPEEGSIEGEAPKFKMEYTEDEKHSGKMSAVLRPIGKDKPPPGDVTDAQFCGDPPFQGGAVRASAFIKGNPGGIVRFGAGLSSEITLPIGSQGEKNGGGWSKFEVVNVLPSPPPTPTNTRHLMCITLGVSGSNRAWIDDVTFTKLDVASIPQEKIQAFPLENLDMEKFDRAGTLSRWFITSGVKPDAVPRAFELSADRKVKRSGSASLHLTTDEPLEKAGDAANYCTDPVPLLGQTLRVSGWIKADLGEGKYSAALSAGAFGFTLEEAPTLTQEEMLTRGAFTGASVSVLKPIDWTKYQVIFAVPNTAKSVCISIRLDRVGSVWADDLSVEVLDL